MDDSDQMPKTLSYQQSFELNPLPPPPINDDDEPIVINRNVQLNIDNDFVNFQLGEFEVSMSACYPMCDLHSSIYVFLFRFAHVSN